MVTSSHLNFQTESDANISTAEARISDAYVAQENVGGLKKDAADVDASFNALCPSKSSFVHPEANNKSDLLTFEIPLNSSAAVDIDFYRVKEEGQDCGVFVKKAKFKVCYNLISYYVTDCWIADMCCVKTCN